MSHDGLGLGSSDRDCNWRVMAELPQTKNALAASEDTGWERLGVVL